MSNGIGAVVLCLSVVLPAWRVHAQTVPAPHVGVAGELGDPAEHVRDEPESQEGDDRPVERSLFGALAGVAFVGAGVAIGALSGLAVAQPCPPASWFCFSPEADIFYGTLAGGGIALAAFYPLGVALGAAAFGGRGDLGAIFLGGLVGDAIGAGIFGIGYAISDANGHDPAPNFIALALAVGAGMVGPVIGHELSDRSARASGAPASITWLPTVSVDPRGGSVGVAGAF